MHKLETLYLFLGQKSIWGHLGSQGSNFDFIKMHYLFYVTKYIHVIHTLGSHLRDKQWNWGQSGVDVSKPAGYAVCDGNMSSFICILQGTLFKSFRKVLLSVDLFTMYYVFLPKVDG